MKGQGLVRIGVRASIASCAVATCLAIVPGAQAATVVVQNTHDHGNGSLRKAVETASDQEKIKMPAGRYRLTSGELLTDKSLRIIGAGARRTIIDGTNSSRVLEGSAVGSKLVLSRLTVQHGNSSGEDGGGVYTNGDLILDRAAVTLNRTGSTGAEGNGGGVYVYHQLVMRRSLLARNFGYTGGGAYVDGPITLVNSTIALNRAGSPLMGNNGVSGAIETHDEPIAVLSSTIAFNRCFNAPECGGAFYNGDFVFRDSIIAKNFAYLNNGQPAGSPGNPGSQNNCYYPDLNRYASAGHNLGGTGDCNLDKPSDRENVNPHLGKLRNNGGQTNTVALGRRSKAINHADSHSPGRDQRGFRRGRNPDIGAFERGAHA